MTCPVDSRQNPCPFEQAGRKGVCAACGFDPTVHVPDQGSRESYLAHCRDRLQQWHPDPSAQAPIPGKPAQNAETPSPVATAAPVAPPTDAEQLRLLQAQKDELEQRLQREQASKRRVLISAGGAGVLLLAGTLVFWPGQPKKEEASVYGEPVAVSPALPVATPAPAPAPAIDTDEQLMASGQWHDPQTNMIWMRCSLGQTWDGATCTGEAKKYTWEQARQAAKDFNEAGGFGGHQDWVVPHLEDLYSLIYCSTGFNSKSEIPTKSGGSKTVEEVCNGENYQRPTIDSGVFPSTPSGGYWTSSPYASDGNSAWLVDFRNGSADYGDKYHGGYVRVVRSGQ